MNTPRPIRRSMRMHRSPEPKPLFDYQVDIAAKVRECEASPGYDSLTANEKWILRDVPTYRRPTQGLLHMFWRICRKCGVSQ